MDPYVECISKGIREGISKFQVMRAQMDQE